jgi:hypothetical protein
MTKGEAKGHKKVTERKELAQLKPNIRDGAIMDAAADLHMLEPCLGEAPLSEVEKVRRIGRTVQYLEKIISGLEKARIKRAEEP